MKRSNGEGSVYRDPTRGGWIGATTVDGRRRRVRARTKTDVLAKLAALHHDRAAGVVAHPGNLTVGDMTLRWRERELANRELAPTTTARYRWALERIDAELGSVRLRALDVDRVESALDAIASGRHGRGRPLARASTARVRDVLVAVLDFAVRRKALAANPARLAVVTSTAERTAPRRALLPTEASTLWDALEHEPLGGLFRLMLTTGLRPGEAGGLCWDAVDLEHGVLTVRRAVRLERGRPRLVDQLKTAASYRTVAVPEPALAVLRRQRRTMAGPALVFPTAGGGPWHPAHVRADLARISHDAGLGPVRPNELRHSAASLLNDRGVPLEQIADLLGHKDITMVSRVYRHRQRPSADAAVAVMGDLFGAANRR